MRNFRRNAWLVEPQPDAQARRHIVMFPYAGAGASSYFSWTPELARLGNVVIVQLPGREERINEPLIRDIAVARAGIVAALDALDDRPLAFFGHSLGALVAYEVCRGLLASGRTPQLLVASGRSPPQVPMRRAPVYELPRGSFFAHVAALGGTAAEVLRTPQMLDYFEPILRADLEMNDRYDAASAGSLPIPVLALAGRADVDFPPQDVEKWCAAGAPCWMHTFEGGHFFVNEHRAAIVSLIDYYFATHIDGIVRA